MNEIDITESWIIKCKINSSSKKQQKKKKEYQKWYETIRSINLQK